MCIRDSRFDRVPDLERLLLVFGQVLARQRELSDVPIHLEESAELPRKCQLFGIGKPGAGKAGGCLGNREQVLGALLLVAQRGNQGLVCDDLPPAILRGARRPAEKLFGL
eukprot:5100754-Pyramimonas_sp.AAC.1